MARNYFARAVNITPKMAAEFIQFVKLKYGDTVTCIVAPYEADAQLAYLSKHGLVDAVVSEDSDCIAYGCSDIIFKLNRDGSCDRLILSDIYSKCIDTKFDLRHFSPSMFLEMCIIAGCDYLVIFLESLKLPNCCYRMVDRLGLFARYWFENKL